MKPEDMTALLMDALEAQCSQGEAPRLMMVEADDFSSVSLEGSFDIRAVAAHVAQRLPREPIFTASEAGSVQFDGKGGLTISIAPGVLGWVR
ncbi:hypothetical protein D1227_06385 [Henriciella mobilis]|uniref:hypothetical protein n=1 Tax=Henriciella mobilis TaxID=2305467 RepID=UPI000E66C340|nr:hypothetical protein [Henriciella mobilis]RIJ15962.1 hypothetical protein D1231_09215 [Henriciella mobilis]RIJ21172.1 hypothetical protein D1227_12755 [Henriciella mobilis]RIJ23127.1 hypothetical protein D1227_06385 [Henriciella mobilis]